ncbi:MAG: hypothetical protein IJF37_05160 [Lachnospiraceae bacterium]|nr:hypothetical protein [Lachnospiraceae bacterium]
MEFRFQQDMYGIEMVDLIVYSENGRKIIIPMKAKNTMWVCTLKESQERVIYRFRINGGSIELNDPNANYYITDKFNKVWSVREEEVTNESSIKIVKSVITDRVMNDINKIVVKKGFNLRENKEVVVGAKVSEVIGVHLVTVIWFQPDGRMYHIDERTLMSDFKVDAEVWFWLKTSEMSANYCKGAWTLEMYIDGDKVVRDNFIINEKISEQYIGFSCTA